MHTTPHITEDQYRSMEEDNIGICTTCGHEQDCCEPDAENYICEECGEHAVLGMLNLLFNGDIVLVGPKYEPKD